MNMPNVTSSFCSIDWSDAAAEGVQTSDNVDVRGG